MITIDASIKEVGEKISEWESTDTVSPDEHRLRTSILTHLTRNLTIPTEELILLVQPILNRIEDLAIAGGDPQENISEYFKIVESVYDRGRAGDRQSSAVEDVFCNVQETLAYVAIHQVRTDPEFVLQLFGRLAIVNDGIRGRDPLSGDLPPVPSA